MRWLVAIAVVASACGRYQFEPRDDASAPLDGPDIDTSASCLSTFCEDFSTDMGLLQPPRWDQSAGGGAGMLGVANGQLTVTLPGTGDSSFLVKTLPAPTTSVTIRMRISYATTNVGTDCEIDLVQLTFASGCAIPFGFYLVRDGTGPFNLQETNGNATCSANRNNYFSVLENTGPHDVKLTIGVGSPGNAALFLDGAEVYNRATLQPVPSTPMTLGLGGGIIRNAAAAWTITYDDVIIDVK